MRNYVYKLRHILPAFLLIAAGSIITIVALRWLLTIRIPVVHMRREIWEFGVSGLVPAIAVLIWLRPRIGILAYEVNGDNKRFYLMAALIAAIGISGYNAQNYVTTSLGRMQPLRSIYQIDSVPPAAYYDLHDFTAWRQNAGVEVDIRTGGRHDEDLDMAIYIATPILGMDDTAVPSPQRYWYAVKYKETIKNNYTPQEKEKYFNEFYEKSVKDLNTRDMRQIDHFSRMEESSDRDLFVKAIEKAGKKSDASLIILEPEHESYENRSGNSLIWIFIPLGIGLITLLISMIWAPVAAHDAQVDKTDDTEIMDMLMLLIPRGDHLITSIILDLNILVFLVMCVCGISPFSPTALELLHWSGNRRAEVLHGEWWRLLTNVFVHSGVMHLVLNSVGLVIAALIVEPFLGRRNYLILYLISGIGASLASIWWHVDVVSVGASGAIFGVYGAILGLALMRAFTDESRSMFIMIGVYVAVNILYGLTGNIDNAAHIGGLITGAIVGAVLFRISGPRHLPDADTTM